MTYDPETYWPERYEAKGPNYVAAGSKRRHYKIQLEAVAPFFAHLPTEGRVLDFGCGPERFRKPLEEHGLEWDGVDLIPGLGSLERDEVDAEAFDAVTAIYVLQHIVDGHDYRQAVRWCHDRLRPGGVLLVVDHEMMEDRHDHMKPRGPSGCFIAAPWKSFQMLGTVSGHWVGLFRRFPE